VDKLQTDWRTGQVLRVDILTPVGREFARQHDFVGTPTFVLFDGTGREIKRWQQPPSVSELEG
jgi:thioredoxin-related protein